jgi:excisionase family DNA binding protein
LSDDERFYTVAEAADILRRTPRSVRDLCVEHKIPATRPEGSSMWLIPVDEFHAWIAAGRNKALAS